MPTTFANTIDGNDIYAKRAECDAAGNTLSTTYATKSELPDGVPAVTSSDDSKVLKASYSGGVGSYSWEAESGGTVTDVEVDGTSVVSGGVASITMPTELVPTVGSGDNAKVLTAAYDSDTGIGSYSWKVPEGLFVAIYGTSTYAEVHAAVEAGKIVYCSVSGGAGSGAGAGRMAFLAYRNPGWNYEFQYYRSNSSSSGTDSVFVYKLNSTNTWETTERTVKAGNISYPVTNVKVNGSSVMSGTVAEITLPTIPVTDVEVDGTSVVSGGVASITMPTELVPAVTSSDNNKVLKASYSGGTGSYSWQNESGGGGGDGADWAAEEGEPGYIENKPVPKTLTAGANITISEGVSTLTISAAPGLPASTSADEGKCLVVDSNGDPEWGTGGKTYTGTDGVVVDNVNDTVGLEAPVDLVGGPGIVVDNPDGNTVRVSYSGYNETLLWSSSTAASSFTLSEIITNFERLKLLMQYNGMKSWCDGTIVSAAQFTVACCGYANNSGDGNRLQIFGGSFTSSDGKSFASEAGKCIYFSNGSSAIGGGATSACTFLKIYGINRIAGGN